jgi:hypothetical protein
VSAIPDVSVLLRVVCVTIFVSLASLAHAADAPASKSASITELVQQMAGTWQVKSKMWPGPDAKAIDLPPATARREVVRNAYLQEVMQPAGQGTEGAFTRVAYFSFNPVNQQYEYFSLDSRLPQMMSYLIPGANKTRDGKVELAGTSFVAPEWGAEKNVPFMFRLTLGPVENNQQIVQLHLREQRGQGAEFLAFEYVYSRQP